MTAQAGGELITIPKARRMLACGPKAIQGLVESGRLTVLRVPGSFPKVSLREVEALASECTRRAGSAVPPTEKEV